MGGGVAEITELPDPLQNANQIYRYMLELGYRIGPVQPSRWINAGKLKPLKGGGWSKASVRQWAKASREKLKRDPAAPEIPDESDIGEDGNWATDHAKYKALLVKENYEKEARKNAKESGKLISKAEHVPAVIAAIHIVERNVRTRIAKQAREAVAACGGDPARRQALVAVMNGAVDDALRVIRDTEQFHVMFQEWGDE